MENALSLKAFLKVMMTGRSEELTQYLFVWATFISVSYCVKKRFSIKIEQLLNILPEPGQTALRLFRLTVVFIFCIIMLPYCQRYLQQSIELEATSAALGIPMFVLSGIIMSKGGVSKKLFEVFAYFVGKKTARVPCAVVADDD